MAEKKALMLASVASMIDQFNISNIRILQSLGYRIDVVADFVDPGTITAERANDLRKRLRKMGVRVKNIAIPRSLKLQKLFWAYKKVKKLVEEEHYDIIHCHSPIGGVLCRMAAKEERRRGTKIVYTAHGFHFYNGASLKNWILFYPVEKLMSRYTDVLITINNEDYRRAKEKFNAKNIVYIPGVGVDTVRFADCKIDKEKKRCDLGVKPDDFLLLSVGELSARKNQKVIIEALGKMKQEGCLDNIVYLAVGKGHAEKEFKHLIRKYGIESHVRLIGFRTDIDELCKAVDCFVHPSVREGLGISPLEAMASGLPLISSDVNGIKDYTENNVSGCCIDPTSVHEMIIAIKKMRDDAAFRNRCGLNNLKRVKNFDIQNTNKIMLQIYEKM